jgi:hypothetical protein
MTQSARVGSLGDGSSIEARIRQLGARLLPPEPRARDGKPLQYEIPPPRLLEPSTTPQQRVKVLAAAYRAVLERRYGVKSRYFVGSAALESHKDFNKLSELGAQMVTCKVAPLAWVLFSFDDWTHTPLGKDKRTPPPTKWVWAKKRWKEQQDRFSEERYTSVQLRWAPEAETLWTDWRCMWVDLMRAAPTTREGVAQVVDRWFPGETYEQRLTRARSQTWEWQARVDREMADGGWPWL